MDYNQIEFKKPIYEVSEYLKDHLNNYSRLGVLPLTYEDMLHFEELIPLQDEQGNDTLWYSVLYNRFEIESINQSLVKIYEMLVSAGDHIPYLKIHRVDFCSYGNSKPFRVCVINEINDNYDYFYVKKTDASRIYGLELEEIFSPDKVNYIVDKNTLVEEHVIGIPADEFIARNKGVKVENRLRLVKEFVKFNERCFVRLLGDMRAYNFVVEITQDFDTLQYRIRAMDFDQQSFEGRKNMYKPQYYKDNKELVELAQELMSKSVADQYQRIERVAMRKRYLSARLRTKSLLRRMKKDRISKIENVHSLAEDLSRHHKNDSFLEMNTMGDLLHKHLELSLGVVILS